jgi:hypothetical protein
VQKRQCAGERRERAAAILASMLSMISSSVAVAGTPRVESLSVGVSEVTGSVDGVRSTGALGTSSSWGIG